MCQLFPPPESAIQIETDTDTDTGTVSGQQETDSQEIEGGWDFLKSQFSFKTVQIIRLKVRDVVICFFVVLFPQNFQREQDHG